MRIRFPLFHFDADPDPAFHFDGNPDGSCFSSKLCQSSTTGLQTGTLHGSILSFYTLLLLHFDPPQLLYFDFDADPDPDIDFDANPDPAP